jgi:hypothetical protein
MLYETLRFSAENYPAYCKNLFLYVRSFDILREVSGLVAQAIPPGGPACESGFL